MINALYAFGAFVILSLMLTTWCVCRLAALSDAQIARQEDRR